jgi:hypothetical protein
MSIDKRLTLLLAAFGGAVLALALSSGRKRRRHAARAVDKADLHEWENEGGNLAGPLHPPAPGLAPATL